MSNFLLLPLIIIISYIITSKSDNIKKKLNIPTYPIYNKGFFYLLYSKIPNCIKCLSGHLTWITLIFQIECTQPIVDALVIIVIKTIIIMYLSVLFEKIMYKLKF